MKNLNYWIVALLALSFSFASCSNDNDDNTPDYATLAAGTYQGYTKAVAQYFPNGQFADDQSVTIKANEDQTVNVAYISTTFGTFTIENATVSFANDSYTIKGEGKTVMGMEGQSSKEYACELSATIDKAKTNPSFVFTVPAVMGGLTITFAPGNAPSTDN